MPLGLETIDQRIDRRLIKSNHEAVIFQDFFFVKPDLFDNFLSPGLTFFFEETLYRLLR